MDGLLCTSTRQLWARALEEDLQEGKAVSRQVSLHQSVNKQFPSIPFAHRAGRLEGNNLLVTEVLKVGWGKEGHQRP